MSVNTTEQELALLKKRLSKLEAKVGTGAASSWRDAFGALKSEPLHREAAVLGAAWRAKENKRK